MAYNRTVRAATLNVRGLVGENAITKEHLIVDIMKSQRYDIMLLQETDVNSSSVRTTSGYTFYYSSDVKQPENDMTKKCIEEAKAKGKGKATVQRTDVERAGVAIVVSPCMKHCVSDVWQFSGRVITIRVKSLGRDMFFTSCYAPHSGYDLDVKNKFYDNLDTICRNKPVHFIGGDMNARRHHRLHAEESILGPYIFGRGLEYLNTVSEATLENRTLFTQFCQQLGLKVLNTCFRRQAKECFTFRENTTTHGPEWTPTRYAQIDFWLAGEKVSKCCKDVRARTDLHFPSDHYIVEASFALKLQGEVRQRNHRPKFRQPTEAEWKHYNEELTSYLSTAMQKEQGSCREVPTTIATAASKALSVMRPQQKQQYISRRTWSKIRKRQEAHEQSRSDTVKELTEDIKMRIKKDAILNSVRYIADQKEKWKGIKGMKNDSIPHFIHMKDMHGNLLHRKTERKLWQNIWKKSIGITQAH